MRESNGAGKYRRPNGGLYGRRRRGRKIRRRRNDRAALGSRRSSSSSHSGTFASRNLLHAALFDRPPRGVGLPMPERTPLGIASALAAGARKCIVHRGRRRADVAPDSITALDSDRRGAALGNIPVSSTDAGGDTVRERCEAMAEDCRGVRPLENTGGTPDDEVGCCMWADDDVVDQGADTKNLDHAPSPGNAGRKPRYAAHPSARRGTGRDASTSSGDSACAGRDSPPCRTAISKPLSPLGRRRYRSFL